MTQMITESRFIKQFNLTTQQIDILKNIDCDKKSYKKLCRFIKKYYELGLDFQILADNWKQIKLLNNDSSSLESHIVRYGKQAGTTMWENKNKLCSRTKEDYIEKYGEDEALKKLRLNGASLEIYKERYGEIDGIIKWNQYLEKRNKSFKSKRGTYARRNLNWFIDKYGYEKGYQIWKDKKDKQAYKVSREYYIDTYGEVLGTELLKLCKSRNLTFFIDKYGIEEGTRRYQSFLLKTANKHTVSKWSLECINYIKESIDDLYFYGENEMVWNLPKQWSESMEQKCILPDLFYKGKIIEFQGNLFHANPQMFTENEFPHPFKKTWSSAYIWKKDELRKDYYTERGYDLLEIWENDYTNNKEEVINKCINFLKSKMK